MRLLRRVLLLVFVLIAGLAGLGAWYLWTQPPEALAAEVEALAGDVEAQFAAAGIPVRIETAGVPVLAFWPWPGLRVGAVRGGGKAGRVRFSAQRALLGISPRHLLAGRLVLGRVRLHGAALEVADPHLPGGLSLTDAELVLAPGPDGSMSVSGEGMLAGRTVEVSAQVADAVALAEGRSTGVVVALSSTGDRVGFEGAAALAPDLPLPVLDGTVSLASAEPGGVARWLTGAEPPPGLAALAALEAEGTLESTPERLLLRMRGSGDVGGRSLGLAATVRGAGDWMRDGTGSTDMTIRAGGLFSAYWEAGFGPDAADGWSASGPVTAAFLDTAALRDWSALALPGMHDHGAARLAGEMTVSPRAVTIDAAELHHESEPPVAGALAYTIGTGAVEGGFGPQARSATTRAVPNVAGADAAPADQSPIEAAAPMPGNATAESAEPAQPEATAQSSAAAPAGDRVTDPAADATTAEGAGVQRGAPLTPGAVSPPGPTRRDPLAMPAPAPRGPAPTPAPAPASEPTLAPALAPADRDP